MFQPHCRNNYDIKITKQHTITFNKQEKIKCKQFFFEFAQIAYLTILKIFFFHFLKNLHHEQEKKQAAFR